VRSIALVRAYHDRVPETDEGAQTVADSYDDTVEMMLPRFKATVDTLVRPSSTIVPGMQTRDSRAEAAIAGLGGRDVTEGLAVEGTLGQGGMGVVRLALQRSLGRHVAVKTLRDDSRSEQARLRLLREAWITGALEHPNVVPVYDLGLDDKGYPIIILKRIEGEAWDNLCTNEARMREITGEKTLLAANLRVFLDVCQAVSLAHARGIVHRDLKPENVMIGAHGEVYVVDWGIAVSVKDDPSGRLPLARDVREMAGTPAYMAPEMLGGTESRITERTDIYLLGAVLYEIATGKAPHDVGDMKKILGSIVLSSPVLGDGVPEELRSIIVRAMRRDASQRYETVAELRRAVEQFLSHMASLELTGEAWTRLEELERLLADASADPERLRSVAYGRFGACRFGFQEALRGWPENAHARAGLRRALERMIRFELATKAAPAAAALLTEIDDPPEELVTAVAAAKKADAAEKERLAALEKEVDTVTGGRTRVVTALIIGVLWIIGPIVGYCMEMARGSALEVQWLAVTMLPVVLVSAGLLVWARESLLKTPLNRRLTALIMGMYGGSFLMMAGCWLVGMQPVPSHVMLMGVWPVSCMAATIVLRRAFVPTLIAESLAFLAAAKWPEYHYLYSAAAHVVFTFNVGWMWRDRVPWTDEDTRRRQLEKKGTR
jgi:serine/threonine-protein kinase